MSDPFVVISVWRGPASALAARLGVSPAILAPLVKRRALRRGGNWELQITSPAAMRTLKHALAVADEEP